jgi:septal ring factor EnvC (AmiA/AmiB activator)
VLSAKSENAYKEFPRARKMAAKVEKCWKLKVLVSFAVWPTLFFLVLARTVALGVDWSACANDLDDVHQESDEATDAAREAADAEEELETQRSNVESCSGDCESERSDYEDAKEDFQGKSASATTELDDLNSKISEASISCAYGLGSTTQARSHQKVSRAYNRCSLYQRYKGRLPLASILKVCATSMSETDCRKCLGMTQ